MKAIINAGGYGTRLRPYTFILPKPLVPVGHHPVIEILLQWLRRSGIHEVYITTGYLSHLIKAFCGDGSRWDMQISYVEEDKPLSTAGPLKLIGEEILNDTFIMLNGDIITDLDILQFVNFHKAQGGILSIACSQKVSHIDFGVLERVGSKIANFKEKPSIPFSVSMGIYCMEPEILKYIPENIAFGFDNLMHLLLNNNIDVYSYDHYGVWLDIGRTEDYEKSQEIFAENSKTIMGI